MEDIHTLAERAKREPASSYVDLQKIIRIENLFEIVAAKLVQISSYIILLIGEHKFVSCKIQSGRNYFLP